MIINNIKELNQKVNQMSPNDLLKHSARLNSLECAKLAIKRGANIRNDYDYALRLFAYNNNLKGVKFCIDNSIDNSADLDLEIDSALNYAIMNKNLEMIKYLMNLGATTVDPFFEIRLGILLKK